MARALAMPARSLRVQAVGGGDSCQSSLLISGRQAVFVKTCPVEDEGMLAAEADGLAALAKTGSVRVPGVLGRGLFDDAAGSWLALEALDLRPRSHEVDARLGVELAQLHGRTGQQFGWHCANFIGRMPQANRQYANWTAFFLEQRLLPQCRQLLKSDPERKLNPLISRLIEAWKSTSNNHHPEPALLHGDLWAGNAAALPDATPVIFDPAVHYGDRECDLAMADLFGGFSEVFFSAYQQAWPLPDGWQQRRGFYQLYHWLNHANLFGGSYRAGLEARMRVLIGSC